MPKRYKIKHIILLRLYDNHTNAKPFGAANEVKTVRISEDALAFGPLTKDSIRNFYKDLVNAQEICAYYDDSTDKLEFSILDNGIMAVSNKKYFNEGVSARYQPLLLPVLLIICSAIAAYFGGIMLEQWKQINIPSK